MQQSRTFSSRRLMEPAEAAGLSARLRERIFALQHGLDRASAALTSKATPKSIHGVRVAARRLRAFLRAFRRDLDPRSVKQYRRSLRALTRDLDEAREADVTRRAIGQLAKDGRGSIRLEAGALHGRAAEAYQAALQRLRSRMAVASWRRRLSSLRRLSMRPSLVPPNDEPASMIIMRRVKRIRRRLLVALRDAGRNPKGLHRLRLKVKQARYVLADSGATPTLSAELELKALQHLQDCLGDMHDEENLRQSLRARRLPRRATRSIVEELERRKDARFKEFRKFRNEMLERWRDLDILIAAKV
jgi:CHAD domain-containing protein